MSAIPERTEGTLADDLARAAAIGARSGGGINRFAWTDELGEVTDLVAAELERLGLEVATDPAGNLIGRWKGRDPDAGAIMTASHLDTVPDGGAFDGTLGVLSALEAVRQLRREGFEPERPIWIGAFMDEEGTRFGTTMFGSRAFCGEELGDVLEERDAEGATLRSAIRGRGLDPDGVSAARGIDGVAAYVELHVEQGPVLWERGARLGVVESITGLMGYRVRLHGQANHAGTTPIDMRRDALVGASRIVLGLRDEARRRSALRATVGRIRVEPCGTNVIPGFCELSIDLRASDDATFAVADEIVRELVTTVAGEEGLTSDVSRDYAIAPCVMDAEIVAAIEAAAADEGASPVRMFSGAGHDAMVVARHASVGMLFVPSRNGVSHSPDEWTDTADCELGARVLAGTLRRLAS